MFRWLLGSNSEQTKRHNTSEREQTRRQQQSNQHEEAMAKHHQAMKQLNNERDRIAAERDKAIKAMKLEEAKLANKVKMAREQREKESKEREDALKRQQMINEEKNIEKKREQRKDAIDTIKDKLDDLPETIKEQQDDLTNINAEFGSVQKKLKKVNSKLSNWGQYKEEQLKIVTLELNNAKCDYERDDNAVKDTLKLTGIHEQNVGKFLYYAHNLINATLSTRASANKLEIKISSFGELLRRMGEYKFKIQGYITNNEPTLKSFIPILAEKNFVYLDDLKCKNEDEFEKDIIPLLEKGIITQQNKNQEIKEKKEEKKEEEEEEEEEEEKSFRELLTEWGLTKFIDAFEEDGWDDPKDWKDLENDDLKELKLKKGNIKKFRRCYKKWIGDDDEPLIGVLEKRKLRSICLESATTWEQDAKVKARESRNILLITSPLLSGFYDKIEIAVQKAQIMLEYPDKNELTEQQSKAIKLNNDDDEKKEIDSTDDMDDDEDKFIRETWGIKSECKIFSESKEKWYDGTIIKITNDDEGEWLNVEYKIDNDDTNTMVNIQRFAKEIKPIKSKQDKIFKTESRALTQVAIIEFNITELLREECKGDTIKLMALNLAIGVEQGCIQIFKSQGIIRESVILAQHILKLKPANMDDEMRKKLWSAVDDGIINIFNAAIEMVKVSGKYFSFFARFKQSFGYFMQCYHNKTEQQQDEISLVVSMEYLQKDIAEFDSFQINFVQIVKNLEEKSMNVMKECVITCIGAEEFEKSQNSREKTKEIYLQKQKQYDDKLKKLDEELDETWEGLVPLASKFSELEYKQKMLSQSIEENKKYRDSLRDQLEKIQNIQI